MVLGALVGVGTIGYYVLEDIILLDASGFPTTILSVDMGA